MADKVYIGSGKEIETRNGTMMKLSFSADDVAKLKANLNDRGWVNLVLSKRREQGKNGQTHYMTVDDWRPADKPRDAGATRREGDNEAPF